MGRLTRMERALAEQIHEARAARANFLMAVNQIGKLKEVMDSHVHTMTDESGDGTTRPQGEVINIIHQLVQVLESEANSMRVDQNAYRSAVSSLDGRLRSLEMSLDRLCRALSGAVDPTRVFDTAPDKTKP